MPELRQSLATKEWVIIATERAKRPHDFVCEGRTLAGERPARHSDCPFCPGNEEEEAARERLRLPDHGPWQVRALLNRYPALALEGERVRQFNGVQRRLSGVGRHEVIVEAPEHNSCLALMAPARVELALQAFQLRGRAFAADDRVEHVIYFENHGAEAGTSIEHPHAQMLGLPLVPFDVRGRGDEAQRYFDDTGNCVHCDMWQAELAEGVRIITANDDFIAFIPYAAFSPFHTWIMPRRHHPSFLEVGPAELAKLAQILRDVLGRLYAGLRDPDYNFIIRSAPLRSERPFLHWYLSVIPRVTESAGFEMGSGMFINTALPEDSAAFLRETEPVEG